tara:strand:+ start:492 stop:968 length:477 start_codon:yes stop_codon:yes gene_type:complete
MYYKTTYLSDELDGFVEETEGSYGVTTCYFDGACYPTNPNGHIGWGFHVSNNVAMCGFIKKKKGNTNNIAEYLALYHLLMHLIERSGETIHILGDSKMVVMQMRGEWKIKEGSYVEYALRAKKLYNEVSSKNTLKITWIPREENIVADRLSTLINTLN